MTYPSLTLLGLLDRLLKGGRFVRGKASGQAQKGGGGVGRRTVEKGADHLLKGRFADLRGLRNALVDIGLIDRAVLDEAALFEPGEERADRRIRGRIGHGRSDLGGGRLPKAAEDLEKLAFATGK